MLNPNEEQWLTQFLKECVQSNRARGGSRPPQTARHNNTALYGRPYNPRAKFMSSFPNWQQFMLDSDDDDPTHGGPLSPIPEEE